MLCKEGEGTDLMLWNMTSPVHFCTSSLGGGGRCAFLFRRTLPGVRRLSTSAWPHDRARYGRENQLFNEKSNTPARDYPEQWVNGPRSSDRSAAACTLEHACTQAQGPPQLRSQHFVTVDQSPPGERGNCTSTEQW